MFAGLGCQRGLAP